jgi:uncharacterized protein (DUF1499 family)
LVVGMISVASLVLGPLLSGVRILGPLAGFGLAMAGGALGIFGLLVGIVAAARGGLADALSALVTCGAVAGLSIAFVLWAQRYPPMNDISTDTTQPPEFVRAVSLTANHGRDMSYPGESFARRQQAAYPDIAPGPLPLPPREAWLLVEKASRTIPKWEITSSDPETMTLEGIAETPLFRFVDDFVIQVRAAGTGSVIHMRSRSREGKGDLGVNARRIRDYFAALQRRISASRTATE